MNWRVNYIATVLAITGVGIYVPQWLINDPIAWSLDMDRLEPGIIVILIILGLGFVATCIALWRYHSHRDPFAGLPDVRDKRHWFTPFAIAVIIYAFWSVFVERDERMHRALLAQESERAAEAARIKAGWLPSKCREIVISLDDCGPKGPGLTDQVVFAIATQPDCGHINHGCTRIAARPYLIP